MIISDRKDTLTNVRCLDLRTGEVRSVRLGLCEREEDVHFNADGKRVVVYRPSNSRSVLGSFVLYTL